VNTATRNKLAAAFVDMCVDPRSKGAMKSLFGVDGFALFSPETLERLKSLVEAGQRLGVTTTPA
jgi:hypothetical protein